MNEQWIKNFFGDNEDKRLGTGWWANVLSAFFGVLALGGVLCLYFPQLLTTPELRDYYTLFNVRILIQVAIWLALFFGSLGSILRKKKVLALFGLGLATLAAVLGGANVPIDGVLHNGPALGLDYFLLDLFAMTLIYVPLERLWPQYPKQDLFSQQYHGRQSVDEGTSNSYSSVC